MTRVSLSICLPLLHFLETPCSGQQEMDPNVLYHVLLYWPCCAPGYSKQRNHADRMLPCSTCYLDIHKSIVGAVVLFRIFVFLVIKKKEFVFLFRSVVDHLCARNPRLFESHRPSRGLFSLANM